MSTAPINWTDPKTDFTADSQDGLMDSDINAINTNVNAVENGNRTLDPTLAPSSNTGTLRQLLDRFACQIGKIMGKNWYDPVTTNFKDSFWFSAKPEAGTVISASPADPAVISSCFCMIPPHSALKLRRAMWRMGWAMNISGGHLYQIWGSVPGEGVVKIHTFARHEGSQVDFPYQGDLHLDQHIYANNSDNDAPFTITLLLGGGNTNFTLTAPNTSGVTWEGHFQTMFDFVPW